MLFRSSVFCRRDRGICIVEEDGASAKRASLKRQGLMYGILASDAGELDVTDFQETCRKSFYFTFMYFRVAL